jgi:hypothetical protein
MPTEKYRRMNKKLCIVGTVIEEKIYTPKKYIQSRSPSVRERKCRSLNTRNKKNEIYMEEKYIQ